MSRADTFERVRHYFGMKRKEIAAIADAAVCKHPGLIGSHREGIQRVHLRGILPKGRRAAGSGRDI